VIKIWTSPNKNIIYVSQSFGRKKMAKISLILVDGQEKVLDAPEGLTLMEIAQNNDIEEIEGVCGGSMACATCHMYIHPNWWKKCLQGEEALSDEEEDMLDLAFDVRESSRLGCQIIMNEDLDGLVIALPGANTDW
jgi:2Fe-2S ferredoxin